MTTFEQARAIVTGNAGAPAAPWGWENDQLYVIPLDFTDEDEIQMDEPARLVDKKTGTYSEVFGLLGEPAAPDLRPINNPPE